MFALVLQKKKKIKKKHRVEKHNHACEMTNMFSVSRSSSSTADFLEVRHRPRGAKWSLMGVLS